MIPWLKKLKLFSDPAQKTVFAESPEPNGVSKDYFFRMMSPQASKLAKSFNAEETQAINNLLDEVKGVKKMNFVVIGAGTLWYLRESFHKVKRYVEVDPLADLYLNSQFKFLIEQFSKISLIEKRFQNIDKNELPEGNSIYAFIFNILSYIEHPIKNINRLLKPGDVLFISSWRQTKEAKKVRSQYFNYLNTFEKEAIIDPEKTTGLCYLNKFPFERLKHYKSHTLIHGKITDILVIYT